MGLLDDAIREHLELKRRHGADEGEVSRLETEAFGASAPAAQRPEPPAPEPGAEPGPEPAAPAPAESEPAAPEPVAHDPEPPHGDVLEPQSDGFTDDEPWLDEPDEVPHGERLDRRSGQSTSEFTPEDHADAVGEDAYVAPDEEPAEDLLEETPEFLQETPEHDRLWFEQKPPRDFDFGG